MLIRQIMRIQPTTEIVFPELSYKILGAAFRVFNRMGWGLSEKAYQKAVEREFMTSGIAFKKEVYIPLTYGGTHLGRYFADFVIENKILLELKAVLKLEYAPTKQVLGYLRSINLELGILLYFNKDGVKYRRVLNSGV